MRALGVLWMAIALAWMVVALAWLAPRCEPSSSAVRLGHMLIGGCE